MSANTILLPLISRRTLKGLKITVVVGGIGEDGGLDKGCNKPTHHMQEPRTHARTNSRAHTRRLTHIHTYTPSLLILIMIIIIIIIFIIFIAEMTEDKNGLAKRIYSFHYQTEAREVLHCQRWQSAMVPPLVAGLWQKASVWVYLRRQTAIYLVYLFVLSLSHVNMWHVVFTYTRFTA